MFRHNLEVAVKPREKKLFEWQIIIEYLSTLYI